MKITLSKSQWQFIGKKAGWGNSDGDVGGRDLIDDEMLPEISNDESYEYYEQEVIKKLVKDIKSGVTGELDAWNYVNSLPPRASKFVPRLQALVESFEKYL